MGQFEYYGFDYDGYKESAEFTVNCGTNTPVLKEVFRDSIMPRVLSELSFGQIVDIVNILKEDSTIVSFPINFQNHKSVLEEFEKKKINDRIDLYLNRDIQKMVN